MKLYTYTGSQPTRSQQTVESQEAVTGEHPWQQALPHSTPHIPWVRVRELQDKVETY